MIFVSNLTRQQKWIVIIATALLLLGWITKTFRLAGGDPAPVIRAVQ